MKTPLDAPAEHIPASFPPPRERIWEIDFLRGLAIILMVFYHAGYDLSEMCRIRRVLGIPIDIDGVFLRTAVPVVAGLFIVLCGISSSLTRSNIRRALKVLAVAALVTLATFFFDRASTVHFGILHCLGTSILIYGLTLEKAKPWLGAAAGAAVLVLSAALPRILEGVPIRFNWLLPLGITNGRYFTVDYFPLLPWLGVFLIGTALGKWLYPAKASLIKIKLPRTFINIAGRHSLLIYVVHQPIILGILYTLGLVRM